MKFYLVLCMRLHVKPSEGSYTKNMKNVNSRKCMYWNHSTSWELQKELFSVCTSLSVYICFHLKGMIRAYLTNEYFNAPSACCLVRQRKTMYMWFLNHISVFHHVLSVIPKQLCALVHLEYKIYPRSWCFMVVTIERVGNSNSLCKPFVF